MLLVVALSVSAFHVAPPLLSAHPRTTAPHARTAVVAHPRMSGLEEAATTWLMAADDGGGGFNPLYLLPLPWIGGIGYLAYSSKVAADNRNDPANECRLGYTVEEMDKMEELKRLRLQTDIKEWEAACEKAEAAGLPKPNGLSWLANKGDDGDDYFGSGKNERPTMI